MKRLMPVLLVCLLLLTVPAAAADVTAESVDARAVVSSPEELLELLCR